MDARVLTILFIILIVSSIVTIFIELNNWNHVRENNERGHNIALKIYDFQVREAKLLKAQNELSEREEALDNMYLEFADKEQFLIDTIEEFDNKKAAYFKTMIEEKGLAPKTSKKKVAKAK